MKEIFNNPDFKVIEFDHFKMQAGFNSFVLSINSLLINQGLPQNDRLKQLNQIAITK